MNTNNVVDTLPSRGAESIRSLLTLTFMFAVFSSLFALGAGDKVQSDGGSNLLRQLTWIVIGLIAFSRCVSFKRSVELDFQFNGAWIFSLLLLIYCFSSFFWSAIPDITFKRTVLFGLMVLMCFATFGKKSSNPNSFLVVMAWPLGLLLIFSFIFTAVMPSAAITSIGWRGVTSFKNEFGQICAIALLIFSFAIFEIPQRRGLILLMALLSFFGLVMSQSSTCAVAVIVGLLVSGGLLIIRKLLQYSKGSVFLLLMLIFVCSLILTLLVFGMLSSDIQEQLFHVLGKSSTLTGRTKLWALIWDNSRLHNPWIGGGYGGFWNGLGSPANFTSYRFPAGYVGQAHNGYLDVFNDLGIIGLLFLAVILLAYAGFVIKHYREGRPEFYFHLSFLIYIILENYAESTFFRLVGFLNIVFFASLARVAASRWGTSCDKK